VKRYEALTINGHKAGIWVRSTSPEVLEWTKQYAKKRMPGCDFYSKVSYFLNITQSGDNNTQIASEMFEELCHQGWKPTAWSYFGLDCEFRLRWEGESD